MVADDQMIQKILASATMLLTKFSVNILSSAAEESMYRKCVEYMRRHLMYGKCVKYVR